MSKQSGKCSFVILAAVLGIACAQFGFAQTFHSVSIPASASGGIFSMSAGGNSVWFTANGNAYSYHHGDSGFQQYPHTPAGLLQIAAGGGNSFWLTPDEVWVLGPLMNDFNNIPYRLTSSGFVQMPGRLSQIAVGPGGRDSCHPYEVWGLNSSNEIFRFDYCSGQFNQQPGSLGSIAVGGAGVWGVNSSGQISQLNFATHTLIQIPGIPNVVELTVGPTGTWGLDSFDQVYEFNPLTQTFVVMNGQFMADISAGGNGVWGLTRPDMKGHVGVWRLEPSIQQFVQVVSAGPNSLLFSVGDGSGIWSPDADNRVFAFSTP